MLLSIRFISASCVYAPALSARWRMAMREKTVKRAGVRNVRIRWGRGGGGALFVFAEPSARCRSLIRKAELSNGPAICLKMLDGTRRAQVVN